MQKYILLISCLIIGGCTLIDTPTQTLQTVINPRQAEVKIEKLQDRASSLSGCTWYMYTDSGYAIQFMSQICDSGMRNMQLSAVSGGYAIKTNTGLSNPVIQFFPKDMHNDITLNISNLLNTYLTGDALLGCLVSLSPLQTKKQQSVWRYSIVPFANYADTVKNKQKIDSLYRGCGIFDGSQKPYGYFEYHTGSSYYFFIQLSTDNTLFDVDSFRMVQ